jgi:hypothetical protein
MSQLTTGKEQSQIEFLSLINILDFLYSFLLRKLLLSGNSSNLSKPFGLPVIPNPK